MTDLFRRLLQKRGLDESFLSPKYEDLFDPYLMRGMKEAVARIEAAKVAAEKILIYGDYDADGVTSSTVMREALLDFGCAEVEVMLPDRFKDGFGLKLTVLDKVLATGAKLVITVDNGSMADDVAAALKSHGVDTIITDHHEIPVIPEHAVAVVNPQRADEKYGQYMAGVGVAFTIARALNMRKNNSTQCDGHEKWWLDLVTIGSICDVMKMRGENRIMTYWGMRVLKKTRRPGLRELIKVAGGNFDALDSQAIGFQIGPRINVAGRLAQASKAFDLVNASTRAEAFSLAQELNDLNNQRKALQNKAFEEARQMIVADDPVIVVRGAWHEGIVGIVAGRLLETYHKPAIVLSETESGILKGSGRSFGEFALGEALRQVQPMLLAGGGHAMACGLSLAPELFDDFKKAMNDYYLSLGLVDQERFLKLASDLVVDDFSELTEDFYNEMHQLEPFGEGNEEPIFEAKVEIIDKRILKEKHLSLVVADGRGQTMKLISFNTPEDWKQVKVGQKLGLQFVLMANEWGGQVKIEGRIVGVCS